MFCLFVFCASVYFKSPEKILSYSATDSKIGNIQFKYRDDLIELDGI